VNRLLIIVAVGLLGLMAGCKPTTPSEVIQPDEMEDLLVDYHIARGMAQLESNYGEQTYKQLLYWQAALQKHGYTQEQFDSSMVYYYTRADRFGPIYNHVLARLQDKAVSLGASEGEIGRYSDLTSYGDTANIWVENTTHVMVPVPPHHRFEFSIEGDSIFREGDSFLMQFMADFVYQSGKKDGFLYVAVDYPDTVVVRQTHFSYSGLSQINIKPTTTLGCPKRVHGFFYLGGADDPSTTLRLLFVNNIQLIRFHSKNAEKTKKENTDSFQSAEVVDRRSASATGRGDTVRSSSKVLPASRGTSPNRMVERIDSLKSRK
jgi:hypothetical protein